MVAASPRPALRLAPAYIAVFAVLGVWLPYWPLWLEARGVSAKQVSWILTAGIWLRALAGPFWGNLADRRAAHRQLVFLLALGSAALCALFTLDLGFAGILLVSIPFTMLYFPMIALIDGLTISWTRRTANDVRALDYGRLRLWARCRSWSSASRPARSSKAGPWSG